MLGGVYASHVALRAVLEDARGRGALGSSASATSAASARTPGASFPSSTSSGSRRSRGTTTARWPTVSTTAAAATRIPRTTPSRDARTPTRTRARRRRSAAASPSSLGDPLHARRPALAPLPRLAPAHQRVPLGVGHVGRVPRPDPARRRRRAGALRAHRDPLAAGAHRRRARGERGRGGGAPPTTDAPRPGMPSSSRAPMPRASSRSPTTTKRWRGDGGRGPARRVRRDDPHGLVDHLPRDPSGQGAGAGTLLAHAPGARERRPGVRRPGSRLRAERTALPDRAVPHRLRPVDLLAALQSLSARARIHRCRHRPDRLQDLARRGGRGDPRGVPLPIRLRHAPSSSARARCAPR